MNEFYEFHMKLKDPTLFADFPKFCRIRLPVETGASCFFCFHEASYIDMSSGYFVYDEVQIVFFQKHILYRQKDGAVAENFTVCSRCFPVVSRIVNRCLERRRNAKP